jgi:hypothetical protein
VTDEFKAYIVSDWTDPLGGVVTLHLARRDDWQFRTYLKSDGSFVKVAEGFTPPADIGIKLPAAAIEAITKGIEAYQGHTSHADTEARVLREWLAVEKGRVDEALKR